jgi:hypothetical protein
LRREIIVMFLLVILVSVTTNAAAYDKRKERTVHLTKETNIDGYSCRGWITTTTQGKLLSFDNAAPIPIKNAIIPKGSRIVLFSNLKIQSVCLGEPTRIQGLPCIGYGPESPAMSFYPDGQLRVCYLQYDTNIQGILCHHGSFSRVVLGQDGKLLSCELSKTQVIHGQSIKARSTITLDEFGEITHIRKSNAFRSLFFDILDKIL